MNTIIATIQVWLTVAMFRNVDGVLPDLMILQKKP